MLQQRLAQIARRIQPDGGGKPIAAHNIHLTLVFIGSFNQADIPRLINAVESIKPESFSLNLDCIGAFRNSRVVWIAPSQTPLGLTLLVNNLQQALRQEGFGFDTKPFVPHVTLLRKARWLEPREIDEPINWQTQGFALMQSVSETDGVRYEVLRQFAETATDQKI